MRYQGLFITKEGKWKIQEAIAITKAGKNETLFVDQAYEMEQILNGVEGELPDTLDVDTIARQQAIIDKQQEYIQLLSDEINELVGIVTDRHVWKSTRHEAGQKIRAELNALINKQS